MSYNIICIFAFDFTILKRSSEERMYQMKLRRVFAAVLVLILAVVMLPNTTALAASDIDFTIDVDTVTQYISGDTINCPIKINNQTDKGYVEMELFLTFDPDALNCLSIFENVDGFSTKVEERNGETGLVIYYNSPTNEASVKGEKVVRIQFAVITGVASGEYTLSLKVRSCYGFDSYGNKTNALEKDNILTLSMAKDKKLNIVETNDNSVGNSTGDGSDPNYYYTQPSSSQEVNNKKNGGGSVFGKVVLFIFGAAIVFGAGVVVGFILCQKRMSEDSFTSAGSQPAAPPRRFSGDNQSLFGGGKFGNITGRFGNSAYDEPEEPVSDYYNDRISRKIPAPSASSRLQREKDEDDIDTSYFGRAAESKLGGRNAYDDVYSDGYSTGRYENPAEQSAPEDDYGSYDFLGSRSRRERSDDGYGSFSSVEDEEESFTYPEDDGSGASSGSYYQDRRRHR